MSFNIDILISAVFLIASFFLVFAILGAIFTAFSKKSVIFLTVCLICVLTPLILAK